MNKKSKPPRKSKGAAPATIIARAIREARLRMKNLDEGVYHVVYERPFRGVNTLFFLDVSEDAFLPSAWPGATLFKDERLARLIAREYSALRQRKLYVARVTISIRGKRDGVKRRSAPAA